LCEAFNTHRSTANNAQEAHNEHYSRFEGMVYDVVGPQFQMHYNEPNDDEFPNIDAQTFYDLLHAAQKPLWPRCKNHIELSVTVRLLTIKSEENIFQ